MFVSFYCVVSRTSSWRIVHSASLKIKRSSFRSQIYQWRLWSPKEVSSNHKTKQALFIIINVCQQSSPLSPKGWEHFSRTVRRVHIHKNPHHSLSFYLFKPSCKTGPFILVPKNEAVSNMLFLPATRDEAEECIVFL